MVVVEAAGAGVRNRSRSSSSRLRRPEIPVPFASPSCGQMQNSPAHFRPSRAP